MTNKKLTVYFDGQCYLCSYEINFYRRSKGASMLDFIDITAKDFSAQEHNLNPYEVHKQFHVKTSTGDILKGTAAFAEIWKILPELKPFRFIFTVAFFKPLAQGGYHLFSIIRPYLPRKKGQALNCQDSPYCQINHHAKK